jgi:hypothetical protein
VLEPAARYTGCKAYGYLEPNKDYHEFSPSGDLKSTSQSPRVRWLRACVK